MENKLKEQAGKLLKEKVVEYVIGFGKGSTHLGTSPLITKKEDDLKNLVINPFIVNNLSRYLAEIKGKRPL